MNSGSVGLSKLQFALMGFPRLGAAFYTQTAHECTQSKLNDVRYALYDRHSSRFDIAFHGV
jgi:hypothetical protein